MLRWSYHSADLKYTMLSRGDQKIGSLCREPSIHSLIRSHIILGTPALYAGATAAVITGGHVLVNIIC